jgi:hypothetical protein
MTHEPETHDTATQRDVDQQETQAATWADVAAGNATWGDVKARSATWAHVAAPTETDADAGKR